MNQEDLLELATQTVARATEDRIDAIRQRLPHGESALYCEGWEDPIPEARRTAMPGVQLCVSCQAMEEQHGTHR